MKNSYIIFLVSTLISLNISAQNYDWQWAKAAQQPNNYTTSTGGVAIATDAQGNALVTGFFWTDSITFGSYTLYNSMPNNSGNDVFVVKYNPAGLVLWAKKFGGKSYDFPNAIATDRSGNVYVTGGFQSDSVVTAGISTIYNSDLTDTTYDMYVLKISAAGNFLWVKSFGGDYYDRGMGLATDSLENVYIAAFFQSDSILVGQNEYYDVTGVKDHNDLLIKCDSLGNVVWAQSSIDVNGGTQPYALSADASGNTFMVGRFNGTSVQFGTQTIQNQRNGWNDIYLVKYDPSGNALWAQDAGGSLDDEAGGVTVDAQGNSYVTGYFASGTAVFGSVQVDNDTTNGSGDIFLAKYDPNGNLLWVNGYGGDAPDVANAITADIAGNIYVTGYYYSSQVHFGSYIITNYDNTGVSDDAFVAEFDANGNPVSAVEVGGLSYDYGTGIAADRGSNVYLTGVYRSDDISFGSTRLNNTTTTHNNEFFIAKWEKTPSGISDTRLETAISLYPNPANNMIVAKSSSFKSATTATVYDVAGNVIPVAYSQVDNQISFHIAGLTAGMYSIKFNTADKEAHIKFIKLD